MSYNSLITAHFRYDITIIKHGEVPNCEEKGPATSINWLWTRTHRCLVEFVISCSGHSLKNGEARSSCPQQLTTRCTLHTTLPLDHFQYSDQSYLQTKNIHSNMSKITPPSKLIIMSVSEHLQKWTEIYSAGSSINLAIHKEISKFCFNAAMQSLWEFHRSISYHTS